MWCMFNMFCSMRMCSMHMFSDCTARKGMARGDAHAAQRAHAWQEVAFGGCTRECERREARAAKVG